MPLALTRLPVAALCACLTLFATTARAGVDATTARATGSAWLDAHRPEVDVVMGRTATAPQVGELWRTYDFMRLSDVARGEFMRATQPGGWGLVVRDADQVAGILLLAPIRGGDELRVTGFNTPAPDGLSAALAEAARRRPATGGEFELRALRDIAYGLHTLWLHGPSEDWFIPMSDGQGAEHPWRAGTAYTAAELASWLKPLAEAFIHRQFSGEHDPATPLFP